MGEEYQRGYEDGYGKGLDDCEADVDEEVAKAEQNFFSELQAGWYDAEVLDRVCAWASAPAGSMPARAWEALTSAHALTGAEREHCLAEARRCLGR